MPPAPSDEDLMRAVADGDDAAFARLLERYLESVRRLAWRMLGNAADADDLAQEVFLRLWRKPDSFDAARGGFRPWLMRVAANASIDRLRRNTPQQLDEQAAHAIPDGQPGPEAQLLAAQRRQRVRAAIARLPERQRLAVTLAHELEHSNIETARIMGISVEAVESLLARGRRKLKELLAEELAHMRGNE